MGFGPDLSGDGLPDLYFPRPGGGMNDIVICRSVYPAAYPSGGSSFAPVGAGEPRAVVWEVKQPPPGCVFKFR